MRLVASCKKFLYAVDIPTVVLMRAPTETNDARNRLTRNSESGELSLRYLCVPTGYAANGAERSA